MGERQMGDGAGPKPGIQILPIDGEGQETTCRRRIAVEADGRGRGTSDVARRRGELR